jgi:hypothetical protein
MRAPKAYIHLASLLLAFGGVVVVVVVDVVKRRVAAAVMEGGRRDNDVWGDHNCVRSASVATRFILKQQYRCSDTKLIRMLKQTTMTMTMVNAS